MTALRILTYLVPSIPLDMYEAIARHLARSLGRPVEVSYDSSTSGPPRDVEDPFTAGHADLGFICSPTYFWLLERDPVPTRLVRAAPVFDDPRAGGKPVYFSDVIVRKGGPERAFSDLRGQRWAYNDSCSLSGYFSCMERLLEEGDRVDFFDRAFESGSHLRSIEMVLNGEADGAAIDSNTLRFLFRQDPALKDKLRVIDHWGPYPIQPVVQRRGLDQQLSADIESALLDMPPLETFGLVGFKSIERSFYADEQKSIALCEESFSGGTLVDLATGTFAAYSDD